MGQICDCSNQWGEACLVFSLAIDLAGLIITASERGGQRSHFIFAAEDEEFRRCQYSRTFLIKIYGYEPFYRKFL